MKLTHYIYISAALAMLSACNEDHFYTVGEAENFIMLNAGVADGMAKMQTRAGTRADGDPTFVAFEYGTKMTLRVDGYWKDHKDDQKNSYTDISQSTTGTIMPEAATDKDLDTDDDSNKDTRGVYLSPQLYWDDYGTADPKNMSKIENGIEKNVDNGRSKGLTIYGVAVDGETTAPTVDNWKSISWDVGNPNTSYINQNTSSYWKSKDLLTSNNISDVNTLKFDSRATPNNILYFTHEMTKITVKLTAGAGFNSKFAENPSVRLNGFYYKGTVNAIEKKSTPTTETTDIEMKLSEGGKENPTATLTALVFPGNKFENGTDILTLSADGNKYFVTAAKLNEAIQTAITNKATTKYPGEDETLLHAYNYILNITVNKTAIAVEATIVDWENVKAKEEVPVINVDSSYGKKVGDDNNGNIEKAFNHNFEFYRSTDIEGSYLENGNHKVVQYSNSGGTISYKMGSYDASDTFVEEKMYWPNHSIHYFFRGLYPVVDASASSGTSIANTDKIPSDFVTNKDDEKTSYIKVGNTEYLQYKFPSDLMLAMPITTDDLCGNAEHKDGNGDQYKVSEHGICATEGVIRMNFRYMMSQVKVDLSSTNSTDEDYVDFSKGVTVEILNCNNEGVVLMKDGSVDFTIIDAKKGSYTMHDKTTNNNPAAHNSFHDAIIPQSLTNGSDLLRFKITVTKEDDSKDVYETVQGIKEIEVYEWDYATGEYSTTPKSIDKWEAGKSYTYKLKIQKTGIKITATMADWIPVLASTDIWL